VSVFLIISGSVSGYGVLGGRCWFTNTGGLNHRLTELNQEWFGKGEFNFNPPFWWLTGRGTGATGPVALGGGGGVSFLSGKADSIGALMGGLWGDFELSYPRWINDFVLIRGGIDFGLNSWLVFAHSLEPGYSNLSRWFLNWEMFVSPTLEAMGRVMFNSGQYVGLAVRCGYWVPVIGPNWYGSDLPPDFRMRGLVLDIGLVLGRSVPRPLRI